MGRPAFVSGGTTVFVDACLLLLIRLLESCFNRPTLVILVVETSNEQEPHVKF